MPQQNSKEVKDAELRSAAQTRASGQRELCQRGLGLRGLAHVLRATDEGCLAPERNQFTKPLVAEKEACPSQHSQSHSDYVTRIIDSEIREGRASK